MDIKEYLGKTVDVVIDRPLGYKRPKYNMIYEVNYGYVPGTISGDGEPIDVYVLGKKTPLKTFRGKVIAIIHRLNDNDDKLVVTSGRDYSVDDIRAFTDFQEKFFESIIIK